MKKKIALKTKSIYPQILRVVIILMQLSFLIMFGCSNHLNLTIRSNEELNNGGNPVVVRIYLLKTDVTFQRTTLEVFWKNDKEALGTDLIGEPIELVLHPDETKQLKKIILNKETSFIGAAADFYRPDQSQWKYIYDLSKRKSDEVILAVGRDKLLIATPEK